MTTPTMFNPFHCPIKIKEEAMQSASGVQYRRNYCNEVLHNKTIQTFNVIFVSPSLTFLNHGAMIVLNIKEALKNHGQDSSRLP